MSTHIKVIVIGAGYWGINYIRELGRHCEYVVEPNNDRASYVNKQFGVHTYPNINYDRKFDAAILAIPPTVMVDIALELVKADKIILMEKPIALSMEDALRLRKYESQIMTSQIYLYHPEILRLKEQVLFFKEKETINHVYSRRTNAGPLRSWSNVIQDLAPHDISIFNFLFENTPYHVDSISGHDWATIHLKYLGIDTVSYVSWLGSPKIRRIELVPSFTLEGDNERIIFEDNPGALVVSPMRSMLNDFLSMKWSKKSSYQAGMDVLNVLEALHD